MYIVNNGNYDQVACTELVIDSYTGTDPEINQKEVAGLRYKLDLSYHEHYHIAIATC